MKRKKNINSVIEQLGNQQGIKNLINYGTTDYGITDFLLTIYNNANNIHTIPF